MITPRGGETMTVATAEMLESLMLRALTVVDPIAIPVTRPCAFTVATAGSLLVHVTAVDAPSSALTKAERVVL
jgi:hypothetical protein